jgi:hypothetical protein
MSDIRCARRRACRLDRRSFHRWGCEHLRLTRRSGRNILPGGERRRTAPVESKAGEESPPVMLVGFLIELLVAAEPPTPLRLSVNRNKPHAADTTRDDAAPCAGTTDSTGAATDGGSAREGAGSAGDARFTPAREPPTRPGGTPVEDPPTGPDTIG